MATKRRKSRPLDEMHELPPRKIKSLREDARVSQAVFAAVLNTSVSTVQKWEAGDKKPSGPSLKLLNLIERKGLEAVIYDRSKPGKRLIETLLMGRLLDAEAYACGGAPLGGSSASGINADESKNVARDAGAVRLS